MLKYFIINVLLLYIAVFFLTATPPVADEWAMVPLFKHFTVNQLFTPYGEHRIPVPKLMIIGLAKLTGWNIKVETLVSFSFYFFAFLLIYLQFAQQHNSALAKTLFLGAIISQMTLANSYNLISGWQIGIQLCTLLILVSFYLLSNWQENWRSLLMVLGCFSLAVYSFASGMFGFLTGVGLAFYRKQWRLGAGLAIALMLILVSYWWGLPNTDLAGNKVNYGNYLPLALAAFVLAYVGQSVVIVPHFFTIWGHNYLLLLPLIVGLLLFSLLWWGIKKQPTPLCDEKNGFPYALIIYSLISAVVTAFARIPIYGISMSQGSRYHIIASLFFLGVIWLIIDSFEEEKLRQWGPRLTALFVAIYLAGQFIGGYATFKRYVKIESAVPALKLYERASPEQLAPLEIINNERVLYPKILKELRYNVFNN